MFCLLWNVGVLNAFHSVNDLNFWLYFRVFSIGINTLNKHDDLLDLEQVIK